MPADGIEAESLIARSPPTALPQGARGEWRAAGLRYYSYNCFLRQKFGCRVHKISLDAGFTCPNVDGTVAVGGCTFCDNRSFSPSRRLPRQGILGQFEEGIRRVRQRYNVERFLAYFQPATNTYAPVARLRAVYEEALSHPQAVGLAIGTRPDCVPRRHSRFAGANWPDGPICRSNTACRRCTTGRSTG